MFQIDNTTSICSLFNFQENISGFVAVTYAISSYEIMIFFVDIVKVEDGFFSDLANELPYPYF